MPKKKELLLTENLWVRLPLPWFKELKKIADDEYRYPAAVARDAIKAFLVEKGKL